MANDLFTKEDFIKKKTSRNKFYKNVAFLFSIVIAILLAIFVFNKYSGKSQPSEEIVKIDSLNTILVIDESIQNDSNVMEVGGLQTGNTLQKEVKDAKHDEQLQKKVNINFVSNIDDKVLSVIRGNYGNNPERRRRLGAEYQTIQDKVNEMYRKGLVH